MTGMTGMSRLRSLGHALPARLSRLCRIPLVLLTIAGLAPLSFGAADVRSEQPLVGEQAKRKSRAYRKGQLRPGRILLTLQRALYRPVIVPFMSFLPASLAYRVACLDGDLRYQLDSSRREEIMRCLEIVLGDQLSLAERKRITRDHFRLGSCVGVDPTRMARKAQAMKRLVEIRGLEHIEEALADGKGAIICTAHFGSFNCALSLIGASGFPITAMGRSASNDPRRSPIERFFYRLIAHGSLQRHRRRPNIEPQGQLEVAVQVAKILQNNELVAATIDSPLVLPADRARGVPMDFLNGQALLLPGITTIAKLTKTPLLMAFMRRSADWRHQVLEISPPMSMEGDAVTAFKRCLAMVEDAIRQHPAHWHNWNFTDLLTLGLITEEDINSSNV